MHIIIKQKKRNRYKWKKGLLQTKKVTLWNQSITIVSTGLLSDNFDDSEDSKNEKNNENNEISYVSMLPMPYQTRKLESKTEPISKEIHCRTVHVRYTLVHSDLCISGTKRFLTLYPFFESVRAKNVMGNLRRDFYNFYSFYFISFIHMCNVFILKVKSIRAAGRRKLKNCM